MLSTAAGKYGIALYTGSAIVSVIQRYLHYQRNLALDYYSKQTLRDTFPNGFGPFLRFSCFYTVSSAALRARSAGLPDKRTGTETTKDLNLDRCSVLVPKNHTMRHTTAQFTSTIRTNLAKPSGIV